VKLFVFVKFLSASLEDVLEAANVTFDEAKWAFEAVQAAFNEWPQIKSGIRISVTD
jgi:hypothetical protein